MFNVVDGWDEVCSVVEEFRTKEEALLWIKEHNAIEPGRYKLEEQVQFVDRNYDKYYNR